MASLRPNLWEGKEVPRVSEGWSAAWQESPELGHPLTGHYPSLPLDLPDVAFIDGVAEVSSSHQ